MGTLGQLRKVFDGNDQFVSGGHQIVKSAGATRHADRVSKIPEWSLNDEQVKALLLKSFPKLATDAKQRERAGRWLQIIQLYYRMAWTEKKIAEELNMSIDRVRYFIRAIKWASEGKRALDGEQRNKKPVGRPKNLSIDTDNSW